jgi:hypothetical protein
MVLLKQVRVGKIGSKGCLKMNASEIVRLKIKKQAHAARVFVEGRVFRFRPFSAERRASLQPRR